MPGQELDNIHPLSVAEAVLGHSVQGRGVMLRYVLMVVSDIGVLRVCGGVLKLIRHKYTP